ncbi:GNAT family N-acetyltransferase [Aeropyrum camini]|uniref:Histone acetyltransferase HPA2 n=1 Tax=Aeropyrum camini SY1 = JCM 12091 TaxID=1198449 RepID=U3T9U4_9CREN|nr:GNAT family N-acetyltransferase [Aeropyrum camini]BAN90307.1 histone acetyltransferase HPA2 [Aeropyrum camini SY1 = JCM 12091]
MQPQSSHHTQEACPLCGEEFGTVTLRGGRRVRIRGLCPGDKEKLLRFYNSLSEETIYTRFFAVVRYFDPYIERLLSDRCTLVIVAEDLETGDIVGMAESFVDEKTGAAEGGIIVREDYQGHGLGSALARVMISVLKLAGVRKLYGYVLSDNQRAITLARKLGARTLREQPGLVRVEVDVEAAARRIAPSTGEKRRGER